MLFGKQIRDYVLKANYIKNTIFWRMLVDISFKDLGQHRVVEVSGEVDLYNVSELKKALFGITNGEFDSVIVDMSNVNYMDSSGIGALVAGQKKMRANNGRFALMSIHEDVLNILKLATLDKFFKIYDSSDDLPA